MAEPAVEQEVEIANRESAKAAEKVHVVKIRKDADLTEATNLVTDIKKLSKNIDKKRKDITTPLTRAIKDVNALFKDPLDRLKDAEELIKAEILRYHESVERRAENRAKKIEDQVDSGELGMGEATGKVDKIKQADSNIKADGGSAQIKTVTKIRILNPADLPAKYFMRPRVLEALRLEVEEDVKKKGEPVPAGAEQYQDKQVAVRSA